LPVDFPAAELVVPESIEVPKRAGIAAHARLFVAPCATTELARSNVGN
jgi:hypothetical protein